MVPLAPALLSTITLRPVRCFSASATSRAITSLPPPAGNPTRIFSGLSGRAVSAVAPRDRTGKAKAALASASDERRPIVLVIIVSLPSRLEGSEIAARRDSENAGSELKCETPGLAVKQSEEKRQSPHLVSHVPAAAASRGQ